MRFTQKKAKTKMIRKVHFNRLNVSSLWSLVLSIRTYQCLSKAESQ